MSHETVDPYHKKVYIFNALNSFKFDIFMFYLQLNTLKHTIIKIVYLLLRNINQSCYPSVAFLKSVSICHIMHYAASDLALNYLPVSPKIDDALYALKVYA